ncbi:MAG: TRAP transporter substrate-binding protein DctP [Pseudomonadota bacterium]|nr:hypothetical protein [Gammaproteobacteria bacterium]MEE2683496.1 TRAP transporter substrate-binding protein DctP [Pseudomonadota bacterium]|tara:strand:+ start:680 stop:1813 length:1134 start_codon:yes stop_codon:yes gene_type:complete
MLSEIKKDKTKETRRNLLIALASIGIISPFIHKKKSTSNLDQVVLRYSTHVPSSHGLYTKAFLPFAQLVEKETQGKLLLKPYTDKLLHGPNNGFKAAVSGITDYTHSYITYSPGSFKLLHLSQLPFLFNKPQVASLVVEELYPKYLKEEFEKMGVYLAHCDATSPYNIISRRPIASLDDLQGLKIRVTSGITADIYRQLGATPVAIAAAEIYPAFQQGVIDSVSLAPNDIASYRLYEIGKHYLKVNLNLVVLHYCLNKNAFNSLPNNLKKTFYNLLRVRSQYASQNVYSGQNYDNALIAIKNAGVNITNLSDKELNRWKKKLAPLKENILKKYESDGLPARALVQNMESLSNKYNSWTNEKINSLILNSPIQGIIDL